MTRQEIFDKVAKHLLTQPRSFVNSDVVKGKIRCLYRGPNGTKCAAGCLIPDDEYNESFENKTIDSIKDEIPSFDEFSTEDILMIKDLQNLHDFGAVLNRDDVFHIPTLRDERFDHIDLVYWLKKIAIKNNLKDNVIYEDVN